MTSTVVPDLFTRIVDTNGDPVSGAKMYWYLAGTTTPTTVYTDSATTVPAANPIIADAGGLFAPIYAKDGSYKVIFTDSSGTALYTLDNYVLTTSGGGSTSVSMPVVAKTANYTVQSTDRNTVFVVDASAAPGQNIVITADSATLGNGFPFYVVNSGAAGSITIVGTGSQTINQTASFTLLNQNQGGLFASNGATGWVVAASNSSTFINAVVFYALATFNGAAVFNKAVTLNSSVAFLEQTLVITSNIAAWDMSLGPDAYVTSALAFTFAAPTNTASNLRGKLRINNSAGTSIGITWNAAFSALANSGALPASVPPGTTYFEYWISGSVIYISRAPMNGTLNYELSSSASGTSVDFVVPAWAKRITISFYGLSTNGSSQILARFGTGGGIIATGYYSVGGHFTESATSTVNSLTTGFQFSGSGSSSDSLNGNYTLKNIGSNTWIGSGNMTKQGNQIGVGAGDISLGAVATTLRITTSNGTDTFDAGTIAIAVES